MTMTASHTTVEEKVLCPASRLAPERAVAAKAPDGAQVAIVRTAAGKLYAVGHHDPFSNANVMARGIVGTVTLDGEARDVIQSPMYKEAFDLETGRCTSNADVCLGTWDVVEREGMIVLRNNTTAPMGVA